MSTARVAAQQHVPLTEEDEREKPQATQITTHRTGLQKQSILTACLGREHHLGVGNDEQRGGTEQPPARLARCGARRKWRDTNREPTPDGSTELVRDLIL